MNTIVIRSLGLSVLLFMAWSTTAGADVDPEVMRVQTELAAAFDSETRDDEWATRSEVLMEDAFVAAGLGLGDLSIRCASTLCHIVFTAPAERAADEALEEAIDAAIREAHYAGRMRQAFVSRDGSAYVAFFTREGHKLPASIR